jgi:signal transduction histidine kinase
MSEIMNKQKSNKRLTQPLGFVLGVLLVLLVSLLIFNLIMSPPAVDFRQMGLFLSITAIISVVAGYVVYRMGWASQTPSIRWALLGGYALSSVLTFLNVYLTARLMFASQHDLLLATVLLIFAGGIAMVLGYFLSNTITDRIQDLQRAAVKISNGALDVKVAEQGKDEVAALAHSFNEMTAKLEAAANQQKELEQLRSDLIAWVSHDLQTPLTSVRAILEALADGVAEDPQTQERYLRTAQRNIQSLSVLIDDLFQMAQLDTGGLPLEREWGSITDLISDTLESFRQMAENQDINLQGSASADCDPVDMDTQRIGRVLNNLVGNALRHTPAGGQVTVNAVREIDAVKVTICDDGEGIQPEDIYHVFDRFYRGEKSRSRATGGSGLGLAIARGIVEAHGGSIRVESEPGKGACFSFKLPCENC